MLISETTIKDIVSGFEQKEAAEGRAGIRPGPFKPGKV